MRRTTIKQFPRTKEEILSVYGRCYQVARLNAFVRTGKEIPSIQQDSLDLYKFELRHLDEESMGLIHGVAFALGWLIGKYDIEDLQPVLPFLFE